MAQTFLQEKFVGTKDKVLRFNNNLQLEAVNVSISGISPQLLVSCTTGATITASCNGVVLSAVEDSGTWTFNLPYTGVWTVSGVLNSATGSTEVNVTALQQYQVTLSLTGSVSSTLNENSWAIIKTVSDSSEGSSYWAVGDCKQITLNGVINTGQGSASTKSYSNVTTFVYIVDFDHNSTLEGTGILFQGFKNNVTSFTSGSNNGTYVALVDTATQSNKGYSYSATSYSQAYDYYGWWNGSDLAYLSASTTYSYNNITSNNFGMVTCRLLDNIAGATGGTLYNCLEDALKEVIKISSISSFKCSFKYNPVGQSVTISNANFNTSSVKLYLPSEYELFGSCSLESSYNSLGSSTQTQLELYKSSYNVSKIKGRQDSASTKVIYRTRSTTLPSSSGTLSSRAIDVAVGADGSLTTISTAYSAGIAPLFRV